MRAKATVFFAGTLLAASLTLAQAPPAASSPGPTASATTPDLEATRAEIRAIEAVLPRIADRAAGLCLLARRHAHVGDLAKALDALEGCMALDAGFDPSDSPTLAPLRAEPRFREWSERAQRLYPPVHRASVAFEVPATELFPEGLGVDAADGTFYMGSMHHKKILTFRLGGAMREFVPEGRYQLMPVGGVHVDPADHSVWASTDAGAKQQPELLHFDRGGRLLERYPSPGTMPYDLNDLVLHGGRDLFTTDTEGHHVYRFDRRSHEFTDLKLFRPVFYPNGIALSGDGRVLFVADMLGVVRVDLASGESADLDPGPHNTLAGIDGLYWYRGELLGVQYGTGRYRVMRWRLAPDARRVIRSEVLEYRTPLVDDPTTGAIYRDVFYFIANSGINNLQDDKISDPTKLAPVHIAAIRLR